MEGTPMRRNPLFNLLDAAAVQAVPLSRENLAELPLELMGKSDCHRNAERCAELFGGEAVAGWVQNADGNYIKHSVVLYEGRYIDVTPHGSARAPDTFIRHDPAWGRYGDLLETPPAIVD